MPERPPERARPLTVCSQSLHGFVEREGLSSPVSSRSILPKSARLEAQFVGRIEDVSQEGVLTILTDQGNQEFSASFQVSEFVPGCGLCVGMIFDAFLFSLEDGKELWINSARANPVSDPSQVQARLAELAAKFGDSGY